MLIGRYGTDGMLEAAKILGCRILSDLFGQIKSRLVAGFSGAGLVCFWQTVLAFKSGRPARCAGVGHGRFLRRPLQSGLPEQGVARVGRSILGIGCISQHKFLLWLRWLARQGSIPPVCTALTGDVY